MRYDVGIATFVGVFMFIFAIKAVDPVKFIFYSIFSALMLATATVLALD